jgi:hypothetical protein
MSILAEHSHAHDVSCLDVLLPDEFRPEPIDAAWLLGFELARIGEFSEPPGGYTLAEADAFRQGWAAGERSRDAWEHEAEEPDWDSLYDDFAHRHPDEVVRAVGVHALRMEGGAR